MKKALSISIANTLFYIEEDAYHKLDAYLKSVREHFASYPDKDEVVSDIESRIAEQFTASGKKVITLVEVEDLIKTMGDASDFGDEPAAPTASAKTKKRLFRNPDDTVIAGVCSGIAAYLDIDPSIVRFVFIASILFGGTGIFVYIILWIVVPEAATTTEKLQMRGDAVTLESVSEMVKEKASELKSRANRGGIAKFASLVGQSVSRVVVFLSRRFFPLIGRIVGAFLVVIAFASIVALTVALFSALFGLPSSHFDFPLRNAVGDALYYATVVSGFGALVIPALFALFLGISMVRRSSAFGGRTVGFAFLSIWFISLIALGVAATRVASIQSEIERTDPSYQSVVRSFDIAPFTKIEARNGQRIELAYSTTTSVSVAGRQRDIDSLSVESKDGVLIVANRPDLKVCVFCVEDAVVVTVTAPSVDEVSLSNASRISGDLRGAAPKLMLRNGSRADLAVAAQSLSVELENVSRANLTGSTTAATARLDNGSNLDMSDIVAKTAAVTARNRSRAYVNVENRLDAKAQNGSRILYFGMPEVVQAATDGSRIGPASGDDEEDRRSPNGRTDAPTESEAPEAVDAPAPPAS